MFSLKKKKKSNSILALCFTFVRSRVYLFPCRSDLVLKGLTLGAEQKSEFGNLHVTGITSFISWIWFVAFRLYIYPSPKILSVTFLWFVQFMLNNPFQ